MEAKKELLEREFENIKIERSNFIKGCFLDKTYEDLMKAGITLDYTGRFTDSFLLYIQEKEKLSNRIIKKRFNRDLRELNPKIALLGRLEYDVLRKYLRLKETPLIELSNKQWQEVKEVLLLIKRNIKDYIIEHHQYEINQLNAKLNDFKDERNKEV